MPVTELQRREQYVDLFTEQEKQLFLPIVRQCLENRSDKRASSVMLVQELRGIESTLPRGGHVSAPIEPLRQQLSAKEEEWSQKDEVIKEKDEALKEKDEVIGEKDKALSLKDEDLRGIRQQLVANYAECRRSEGIVREKSATIREQQTEILQLRDRLAVSQKVSLHTSITVHICFSSISGHGCNGLHSNHGSHPKK